MHEKFHAVNNYPKDKSTKLKLPNSSESDDEFTHVFMFRDEDTEIILAGLNLQVPPAFMTGTISTLKSLLISPILLALHLYLHYKTTMMNGESSIKNN